MEKKLILRILLRRLVGYLAVVAAFGALMVPIYSLMHQQTERAEMADVAEQMAVAVNELQGYMDSVRFTTNRLFNSSEVRLLAMSGPERNTADGITKNAVNKLLGDLVYNMNFSTYQYITFRSNELVLDGTRSVDSYERFYDNVLRIQNVTREQWTQWQNQATSGMWQVEDVSLNRNSYTADYLLMRQSYSDGAGDFDGSLVVLMPQDELVSLFLSGENQEQCLFYLKDSDNNLLMRYNFDDQKALNLGEGTQLSNYHGERHIFVSMQLDNPHISAVVGVPYRVYASQLRQVDLAMLGYVMAGFALSLLLSILFTARELNRLRPVLCQIMDEATPDNRYWFEGALVKKLVSSTALTQELESVRDKLEHSQVEALLKTGYLPSGAEKELQAVLGLTEHNYLLVIPRAQMLQAASPEVHLMMLARQVESCYDQPCYVCNMVEGDVVVILTLEDASEHRLYDLCRQTEQLHDQLGCAGALVLSGCFETIRQMSEVYWQARNMVAYADPTQKVCYLSSESLRRVVSPEVTNLNRLREYLMAAQTEQAQELVRRQFHVDNLSIRNFQQAFYGVRCILLDVAQQVGCSDILPLCENNESLSIRKRISNLCDCCFEICSHVDALRRSHNQQLQQKILEWIGENYTNPDLNAAMTAQHCRVSQKYLSQFLKEQTGRSFVAYVETLRLDRAMELLRGSDLSISEVGAQCGFATSNTFYKAFRRKYGMSPSAVRGGAVPAPEKEE